MISGASSSSSSGNMPNEPSDVVFQQVKNAPPSTVAQIFAWMLVLEVNKTRLMAINVDRAKTNAFKNKILYRDTFDCERASHSLDILHQAAKVGWRSYVLILPFAHACTMFCECSRSSSSPNSFSPYTRIRCV